MLHEIFHSLDNNEEENPNTVGKIKNELGEIKKDLTESKDFIQEKMGSIVEMY